MWGRFNPKPEHASAEMRMYARQLLDKLMPRLPSEPIGVWITVPAEKTHGQVKELGLKVRKIYSGVRFMHLAVSRTEQNISVQATVLLMEQWKK